MFLSVSKTLSIKFSNIIHYRQAVLICSKIHFSSNISGTYRPLRSGRNKTKIIIIMQFSVTFQPRVNWLIISSWSFPIFLPFVVHRFNISGCLLHFRLFTWFIQFNFYTFILSTTEVILIHLKSHCLFCSLSNYNLTDSSYISSPLSLSLIWFQFNC